MGYLFDGPIDGMYRLIPTSLVRLYTPPVAKFSKFHSLLRSKLNLYEKQAYYSMDVVLSPYFKVSCSIFTGKVSDDTIEQDGRVSLFQDLFTMSCHGFGPLVGRILMGCPNGARDLLA